MYYIRDGVRSYVSNTLRVEMYVTDGELWKESKTMFGSILGKYRPIFVTINFKRQVIETKDYRWQNDKDEIDHEILFS